jgi:DNA-binding transcriptional LysR family regulator
MRNKRFDADLLYGVPAFLAVLQEGGFAKAARRLGLSPSAVTRQVQNLEERLGARLITRSTRRLALTEIGRGFAERAEHALAELNEAQMAVADLHAAPRGTLRVNAPVSFGRLHVAPVLPEFLRRYPEISLDLTLSDRFVDLIEEGADLAIRIGELTDSRLIARQLARNRRLVVAAPGYFAARPRPERPVDFGTQNCLVYTYRAVRNEWTFEGPNGRETIRVSGNLESNHVESLHAAVLEGLGIALLPLWMIWRDLAEGRVEEVLPLYRTPDSAIHAVYPPGRYLSHKVRIFIEFLAEHYAREKRWLDRA